jgi:hypothetical protein
LRFARDLKATLFFDVVDIWKKALSYGCEDILLLRFEKGAVVSRVLHPERGPHRDMEHFEIYGPTIIATNKQVSEILETRSLQIIMQDASKHFEQDITPKMGLPFRERLTAFRAKFMGKPLPQVKKPTRGRLGDIMKPLRQIVRLVCPQERHRFLEMVKDIEQKRRESLSETEEAKITRALFISKDNFVRYDCRFNKEQKVPFKIEQH